MKINHENLLDVINILIKDQDTFEQLVEDNTKVISDLISYKDNSNCSCKGKVSRYFLDLIKSNPNALNKYISKREVEIENELNKIVEEREKANYIGKRFEIDNTEEAWKEFANESLGKIFRTFSIVEKENKLVVYFL